MTDEELMSNYLAKDENGKIIERFYDTENKMLDAFDEEFRLKLLVMKKKLNSLKNSICYQLKKNLTN